jgi:hypothetical protein
MTSYRQAIDRLAKQQHLTIRHMYKMVVPSVEHVIFKGSASQVADQMED